ncbi:MAG: hypothetical protein QW505_05725 [Thermoplasmata archaeon]
MPDISVGLNCPTCGGAIQISEGDNTVICQYCNSTLFVEGDQGVNTIAFKSKFQREHAIAATFDWWKRGLKARDLPKTGKILEAYPIYLPFWSATTRVAGWICGYEERRHTDQRGNVRVERIPKEVMILQDFAFSEIACDPGDIGIAHLRNFQGETTFEDFEMIPTFESTTSKDDALAHARADAINRARAGARVPNVTFERLHAFPKRLSLIYYPVWVVRYSYRDRMYMDTVDGVTGTILSGRAPGDPLYQSLAITGGTSIGGLIAAGGILAGQADWRIAAAGVVVGIIVLAVTYLFFRHGSEITQGDFKAKRPSAKETIASIQQMANQLGRV